MKFIRQYQGWLTLLIILNVMTNLLLFLDAGLAIVSLIYFNVLYIALSIGFVVIRYVKDRQQLAQLQVEELQPLQQEVAQFYEEKLEKLEHEMQFYKSNVEEHNDEQLAWVHEMKAPLTALQLLIEQMEHSETKRKLEQEWLRIYSLLDQQLYVVRLQTIEQDIRFEEVVLRELVVGEIRSFKSWCLEKGVGFDLENLEKTVVSDQKWLGYILRQLISNAIKYSHPQSEISIYAKYDAEEHLVVYVRDAGKGIASQDLPRVFQKSYTGATGRESSAASGMGLYLAKQAADKMGLKLTIDSAIGLGTTVKIQFPKENTYTEVGM